MWLSIGLLSLALAGEGAQRMSAVGSSLWMVDEAGTGADSILRGTLAGGARADSGGASPAGQALIAGGAGPLRAGILAPLEQTAAPSFDGRLVLLDRNRNRYGVGVGAGGRAIYRAFDPAGYEISAAIDRRFGRALAAINAGASDRGLSMRAGLHAPLSRHQSASIEGALLVSDQASGSALLSLHSALGPDLSLGGAGMLTAGPEAGASLLVGLGYRLPAAVRPPKDRDGDGLVAKEDRCPEAPEDRDERADIDGCPDPGLPDGEPALALRSPALGLREDR